MPKQPQPTPYDVRGAAVRVAAGATHVGIAAEVIDRWAEAVDPITIRPSVKPAELVFHGPLADTARWVLLLDALNFCFWTDGEPWTVAYLGRTWRRYGALLASLHRAIHADREWLTASRWAGATCGEVAAVLGGNPAAPMLEERHRLINETGQVLLDLYGGEVLNLVEHAGFSALPIAFAAADGFSGYHDVPTYHGQSVPILKRAQILAADLAAAFRVCGGPEIAELESLTAFADYRIPQTLRHLGILDLDARFAARIESRELIPAGSDEEIELRACSIDAVERMCRALRERRGIQVPAWLMDEYLWDRSHDPDVRIEHHRTLTIFY